MEPAGDELGPEGRTTLGDDGKSFENVDREKKPRWGGGGFFRIGFPGRIIGIADDDGDGDVGESGEVGTADGDAIMET